ncbi:MAG: hypothetical protein ACKOW0_00840 [Schleiferiaceae bacterium]
MAAKTIANLRTAGLAPASADAAGFPGQVMLDFQLDGSKLAVAATDTVDFFEIPAYAGFVITAAAITVVRPGTASGTMDLQIGGADVAGCTGWATDAAAGTQLVKVATGTVASTVNTPANVVNTSSASYIRVQQNTAALGSGLIRVRVFGTLLSAQSAQA